MKRSHELESLRAYTGKPEKLAKKIAREEMILIYDLRHAREDANLSIEDVAEALNISPRAVQDIEDFGYNLTLRELRYYLLAIGHYCEFALKSGKNL